MIFGRGWRSLRLVQLKSPAQGEFVETRAYQPIGSSARAWHRANARSHDPKPMLRTFVSAWGNVETAGETRLQPRLDSPEQPEAHLVVIARERNHETHPPVA